MHLHEYQAKKVLSKYGIPIPPFAVVSSMEEVETAIEKLALTNAVLKVQVHAGGRGKAGGVKMAKTPDQIRQMAKEMLGMKLVTPQTGPEGINAHQLLISPPIDIVKEYYVGVTMDRHLGKAVLIASPEGGVEIEEVAAHSPERIRKTILHIEEKALRSYQMLDLLNFMGWQGVLAEQGKKILTGLVNAFIETDALSLEINPLVETSESELVALDAKLTVDDNALYRQPELALYYDPNQINPAEARAKEHDLAYVALHGEIGCMVNGAGLAMATMDIIHHYGGSPANFLDVGGGATQAKVAEGFKIILSDPRVKAILINIFGGIMNCGTLAAGIVAATKELHLHVPLVVRMEGTNVTEGKCILQESNLDIIIANTLDDAAIKAIKASQTQRKST